MTPSVVLIGPPGVGKTTVSTLLAAQLDLPVLDLDTARWDYYAEIGYDEAQAEQILHSGGLSALVAYWKPFELHAVERALAEHHGSVIAFGAGHSFYDDPAQLQRAQEALAGCRSVVLLLPSANLDESVRLLNARLPADDPHTPAMQQIQEQMIRHPANHTLATITVYTAGKTPAETSAEILALIQ